MKYHDIGKYYKSFKKQLHVCSPGFTTQTGPRREAPVREFGHLRRQILVGRYVDYLRQIFAKLGKIKRNRLSAPKP